MKFLAEIKKVDMKKSAGNLDTIYRITFETDNHQILDLGKLPADTLIEVKVSPK